MSSTETSASTIWRYRPAVAVTIVAAGALVFWYAQQANDDRGDGSQDRLHRSNAVRRRSPRLRHAHPNIATTVATAVQENAAGTRSGDPEGQAGVAVGTRRESFAGTLEVPEPDDDTTVNGGDASDGQSLLNMLYHIAVEQASRDGYVHRGVTCNACSAMPIRGIRYRCANCPDYDLCEQCECLGNVHDRTHLFYKIRIPAPFLGANPRQQQPVWYPGKPHVNPRSVPHDLKKQLSEATGLERSLIDALWDQFKTLAGYDWPDDPNGLCLAIDREIWAKYCVPPLQKSHTAAMALLFDRSLTFWDENGDGLIGFEEFLKGLAVRQNRDRTERYRRTFKAHDLDGDGYVTRQDFMDLLLAHYAYCKEQSRDMAMFVEDEVLEGAQLKETLQSTQAVSSCFHGSIPPPDASRIGEGKTMTNLGDMVITDGGGLLRHEDDGLVHNEDSQTNHSRKDSQSMAEIFGPLVDDMPDWPPDFVTAEDVQRALGKRTSLRDITDLMDQARVLHVATSRLESSRARSASGAGPLRTLVARRPSQPNEGDNSIAEYSESHAGCSGDLSLYTPVSDLTNSAPAVRASATQEFLFQKSSEGFSELLDPMFRQLEDLHLFWRRTGAERARLHAELKAYRSVMGNETLCQNWLDKLLVSWRKAETRKAWLYGDDLAKDILSRLIKETEVGSNEWMLVAKERVLSGFTSEAQETEMVERLRAMPDPVSHAKARALQQICLVARRGDEPTPEELNELMDEPLSPKPRPSEPDLDELHLQRERAGSGIITIDENTIANLLNRAARDELQQNSEAFDSGADIDAHIGSLTVNELLSSAGYETTDQPAHVDEPSSPTGRLPDNTPRQSLAHESSFETGEANIRASDALTNFDDLFVDQRASPDVMDAEPTLDPTLPHHRPNHVDEDAASSVPRAAPATTAQRYLRWSPVNQEGEMASIEQHDLFEDCNSEYFQVKLKYLTLLELCAEMATARNGWARINAEEFEQIMTGNKGGQSLQPIGTWLDLASF